MQEIHVLGQYFRIAENDTFWEDLRSGTWEPATLALLDQQVHAGDVVCDIGAWQGPVSLFCAAKGATCHAFEPDPVAFAKLKANVEANPDDLRARLHLNNAAITTDGKPLRLYSRYNFGDSGSSTLARVKDSGASHLVQATTLEKHVQEHGITRIDLMKMDIEGGEFALLPALLPVITRFRPVVLLAVHFPYMVENAEREALPSGLLRRLRRMLMKATGMDPTARFRRVAMARIQPFMEALGEVPHLYTVEGVPIQRGELPQRMEHLMELVLAFRPLEWHKTGQ